MQPQLRRSLKEPLRVPGMYIVPDGDHAPIYRMCEELAESQAELLRSRAMTDKIALFVTRAVLMPALTYKMQGHAFTHEQLHRIFMPIMHALKHACGLASTFPSSVMHHRRAGKVPQLKTAHPANGLTLLVRAMNAPSPLGEITLARIAATEHALSFPGPMLEILWHVLRKHRKADQRGRQLLIPALAAVLGERSGDRRASIRPAMESCQRAPQPAAMAARRLPPPAH